MLQTAISASFVWTPKAVLSTPSLKLNTLFHLFSTMSYNWKGISTKIKHIVANLAFTIVSQGTDSVSWAESSYLYNMWFSSWNPITTLVRVKHESEPFFVILSYGRYRHFFCQIYFFSIFLNNLSCVSIYAVLYKIHIIQLCP